MADGPTNIMFYPGFEYRVWQNKNPVVAQLVITADTFEREGFTWFTVDGQDYVVDQPKVLKVVKRMDETADARFATGKPMYISHNFMDETDMYMLQDGNIYRIESIVECTGDDTCEHCSKCPECASLHCTDHEQSHIVQ